MQSIWRTKLYAPQGFVAIKQSTHHFQSECTAANCSLPILLQNTSGSTQKAPFFWWFSLRKNPRLDIGEVVDSTIAQAIAGIRVFSCPAASFCSRIIEKNAWSCRFQRTPIVGPHRGRNWGIVYLEFDPRPQKHSRKLHSPDWWAVEILTDLAARPRRGGITLCFLLLPQRLHRVQRMQSENFAGTQKTHNYQQSRRLLLVRPSLLETLHIAIRWSV